MGETRLWPSGGQIAWADGKWSLETSRSEHVDEIERLRKELGMAEPAPYRYTNKPAPAESLNFIAALAGERWRSGLAEPTRSPGVDEDTARHEAAHAVAANALGWWVQWVDARSGQTKVVPPEYDWQRLSDRWLQEAMIAASAQAFTGSYRDRPFEDDRYQVRSRGRVDWATAVKKAKSALVADRRIKATYERLTRALLMVGRLEGDALRAVLEDE